MEDIRVGLKEFHDLNPFLRIKIYGSKDSLLISLRLLYPT